VFTANVFALMACGSSLPARRPGRQLVYLKFGIAFILAFIGVKLFFHALHENELPFINGGTTWMWHPRSPTIASSV